MMVPDNMLSDNMVVPDNMLSDNIMLSCDNVMYSDNVLSCYTIVMPMGIITRY
jgi:hypothetical protein